MRLHETTLKSGISRTLEFQKKGLASFAVNVGTKCGHGCLYCSTGAMLRMHSSYRDAGENPFGFGYAIVDPTTPERIIRDARRRKDRGLVQLCTTVDAWTPEAQQHDLGRRCLEAILREPGWTVRILTKNVAVEKEFDVIAEHQDRVLLGLSVTATTDKSAIMQLVEPNASPIEERIRVLSEAHRHGLQTYAMFCPLLPAVADDASQVADYVQLSLHSGAEEVFVEPVNSPGPGLRLVEEALRQAGHHREAVGVAAVRQRSNWSTYTVRLLSHFQDAMRRRGNLDKLRFLLYPNNLSPNDEHWVREHPEGVKWLGKREIR